MTKNNVVSLERQSVKTLVEDNLTNFIRTQAQTMLQVAVEREVAELLRQLQQQNLPFAPHIAVGDGALGFWGALNEVFPTTKQQRCWVHKTANILEKLPKSKQSKAKSDIQDIYRAETKDEANKAYQTFVDNLYDEKVIIM